MTSLLLRDNLFEDLFDARREFDKVFNRMLAVKPWGKEQVAPTAFNFVPAVESYVDKNAKKYVCKVSLPGVDPKEVQLKLEGKLLTITGERKLEKKTEEVDYVYEEFAYGKFERAFELPEGVNTDKIHAEFVNGVLQIEAPVAAVALPKKIEIKIGPMRKQIAA